VVEKGSIAIDGASLTVACVNSNTFSVALIPHTLRQTTLQYLSPGVNVNLEFDLLAKYVEKLLSPAGENAGKVPDREENHSRLTFDFLRENGF
jgi:riboflavin synthase